MIVYDLGTYVPDIKEKVLPGYIIMMDIDDMEFISGEKKDQPHRPLCRIFFGITLTDL